MLKYTRKRFDLICPNSLQCVILELTIAGTELVNIRFSVVLGNGVVTLHDTQIESMISKLDNMARVLGTWISDEDWLTDSVNGDRSELHKIAPDSARSIATISLMRLSTGRIKLTVTDCIKSASETITELGYPCYDLKGNMTGLLSTLGNTCLEVIDLLKLYKKDL